MNLSICMARGAGPLSPRRCLVGLAKDVGSGASLMKARGRS